MLTIGLTRSTRVSSKCVSSGSTNPVRSKLKQGGKARKSTLRREEMNSKVGK